MMRLATLILLALTAGTASAAQPLGRLFFTPAERAALDNARVQNRVPAKTPAAEQPTQVAPAPEVITFDGLVRRSDGQSTLWLNNKPFEEREQLSGGAVSGRVRQDGALTLRVPQSGASINLRVGQSAELQSGRIIEGKPERQEPAARPPAGKAESVVKRESVTKGITPTTRDSAAAKQSTAELTEKKTAAASMSVPTQAH